MNDIIHIPKFLTQNQQLSVLEELRNIKPSFYTPTLSSGIQLNLKMNCLGKHWNAKTYKYQSIREDVDQKPTPPIPPLIQSIGKLALKESNYLDKSKIVDFDVCIVNFYDEINGKLGLHQDNSESIESIQSGYPIVSISIGATAQFLIGGNKRSDELNSILLLSGDSLVFGRSKRLAFHGVKKIFHNTTPKYLQMKKPGRINLTFRIL